MKEVSFGNSNIFCSDNIGKNVEYIKRRQSADDIINKASTFTEKVISNNSLLSPNSSLILQEEENIPVDEQLSVEKIAKPYFLKKALILASSILVGIGTGLAMMPIFNKEIRDLEKYGINIHEYQASFIVSTINTLLVTSVCSTLTIYKYFTEKEDNTNLTDLQKTQLNFSKASSVFSSIMPISLLWNIELNNQKIEGSEGFDKFVAWATFCTIPLLIYKTLESYEHLSKNIKGEYKNIHLDSIGSKLFVYGITLLSAFSRGISFTAATEELCKNIGLDNVTSKVLGILIGGVTGSVVTGITEYPLLKRLFENQIEPFTKKQLFCGSLAFLEGGWFALPSVSVGLDAVENWNGLVKGGIFTPYYISRITYEATNMYNALMPTPKPVVNQVV